MKDQILKLRQEGKSYREIEKILKCSKSTISYHCSNGQKEKNNARNRKFRNNPDNILHKRIEGFLQNKVHSYKNKEGNSMKGREKYSRFYDKLYSNPFCYLTGRKIDFNDKPTYQLDHMIPRSRGGKSSLGNCGLTCAEANQAKQDLLIDEFIELCREVLINFGYNVTKNEPDQRTIIFAPNKQTGNSANNKHH